MKDAAVFSVKNFPEIKLKLLNWIKQFSSFCLLDNHQYHFDDPAFECLAAAGMQHHIKLSAGNAFNQLKDFSFNHKGQWLFGHLNYDLKNETENLRSFNFDGVQFPDVHFFVPEIVIKLTRQQITVYSSHSSAAIFEEIENASSTFINTSTSINIQQRIPGKEYIDTVNKIKSHILRGDCYEMNFCLEFFSENIEIDPINTYYQLTKISPVPFASLYRLQDKYCICASPERYLRKNGNKIISQPIKGTIKRNLVDSDLDNNSKQALFESTKERAENIMIVDLVRNDLSKICKEGTVKAEEIFGIYSFPQVHQMISTVSGEVDDQLHWTDAVKATFPMGSMTGAPKKRVMELIEEFELTKRGLFSGSIGYISPDGNFDFNVVIRSILYNAANHYLSFQSGSAITFYSDAEKEYEECLLKAAAIKQVLK